MTHEDTTRCQHWFQQRVQFQMLGSQTWLDASRSAFHHTPFPELTDRDAARQFQQFVRDWYADEHRKRGLTVCTFRVITTATEIARHPEYGVMVTVGDETIIDQIVIDTIGDDQQPTAILS